MSGYSEKSNIEEAYLPKTNISGQIISEILDQLCSDDSIQIQTGISHHGAIVLEENGGYITQTTTVTVLRLSGILLRLFMRHTHFFKMDSSIESHIGSVS